MRKGDRVVGMFDPPPHRADLRDQLKKVEEKPVEPEVLPHSHPHSHEDLSASITSAISQFSTKLEDLFAHEHPPHTHSHSHPELLDSLRSEMESLGRHWATEINRLVAEKMEAHTHVSLEERVSQLTSSLEDANSTIISLSSRIDSLASLLFTLDYVDSTHTHPDLTSRIESHDSQLELLGQGERWQILGEQNVDGRVRQVIQRIY